MHTCTNTTVCFKENAQTHGTRYSIEPGYCYLKPSYYNIFKIQTSRKILPGMPGMALLVRGGGGD